VSRLGLSYRAGLWLMLLPYLLGGLVLVGLPAIMSAGLAFTTFDALTPPVFVGFQNFRFLAADPLTGVALANTLVFIVLAVPLRVGGALALALLLEGRRRGVGGYRAAVYVPTVIPDVAYALIWLWIFNPLFGPVNVVLGALGVPLPGWLADEGTAKYPFVVMSLFQVGEGFVILLAALRGIPRDYYDAGAVDGAGRWAAFRSLTLPLLMPWLVLLTFRDVIVAFQYTFTPSLVMTGGGPYYSTFFLPFQLYEEAFDRFRFGTGSALMLVTFLLSGALIVGLYLIFRRRGDVGDA
jgi:multiple sugar transport system permease protein